MSIYVLDWIKEDLAAKGESLESYTLLDIKDMMHQYNVEFCKRNTR